MGPACRRLPPGRRSGEWFGRCGGQTGRRAVRARTAVAADTWTRSTAAFVAASAEKGAGDRRRTGRGREARPPDGGRRARRPPALGASETGATVSPASEVGPHRRAHRDDDAQAADEPDPVRRTSPSGSARRMSPTVSSHLLRVVGAPSPSRSQGGRRSSVRLHGGPAGQARRPRRGTPAAGRRAGGRPRGDRRRGPSRRTPCPRRPPGPPCRSGRARRRRGCRTPSSRRGTHRSQLGPTPRSRGAVAGPWRRAPSPSP